jgi:hypothetical protein
MGNSNAEQQLPWDHTQLAKPSCCHNNRRSSAVHVVGCASLPAGPPTAEVRAVAAAARLWPTAGAAVAAEWGCGSVAAGSCCHQLQLLLLGPSLTTPQRPSQCRSTEEVARASRVVAAPRPAGNTCARQKEG